MLPPDHPNLEFPHNNLGEVYLTKNEPQAALAAFHRALAIWEGALGPDNVHLGYALTGIGRALLMAGDARRARPVLERAVAIRAAARGDPVELAESQFALARALGRGADPRARELARAARAAYAAAERRDELAIVDAWLARAPR